MSFTQYLPSKRFVKILCIVFVVCLLGLGIRYLLTRKPKLTPQQAQIQEQTKNVPIGDLLNYDTDGDGIRDWEESLWGTDPLKADTDGNGVSDGIEIAEKKKTTNVATDIKASTDESINETERFSRELFAMIMSLSQSGNLTDTALQNLSATLGQNIVSQPLSDIYTKEKTKVIPTTLVNEKTYYTKMKALITKYSVYGLGTELSSIESFTDTNTPKSKESIVRTAGAYQSFSKELALVPVPESILVLHLGFVNANDKVGRSLFEIAQADENPVKSVSALLNYTTYSNTLVDDGTALGVYFRTRDIIK